MNPSNRYGISKPGDEYRVVCENDEEPMIFGSEEAGFQIEPWITITTTHAVREANIELEILTKKQQILRLKNGRYIIALRVIAGEKENDKSILCLDTGVTSPKPQQITSKKDTENSSGGRLPFFRDLDIVRHSP